MKTLNEAATKVKTLPSWDHYASIIRESGEDPEILQCILSILGTDCPVDQKLRFAMATGIIIGIEMEKP